MRDTLNTIADCMIYTGLIGFICMYLCNPDRTIQAFKDIFNG